MNFTTRLLLACVLIWGVTSSSQAQDGSDILEMSLEDLMSMEITSISKKAEKLQNASSSMYVLTSEDITRSGATTLHEVLRNVPGYWGVQDEYSSVYSSIRNSPTENGSTGTVLYLLDGTPIQDLMGSTFSFVNFDIPMDEIDRIEIIRGSGGTVYGANSATGVVNIFTKNPENYDGINLRTEAAAPGYTATSIRAGGTISHRLSVSGYGKFRYFSGFESMAGVDEDGNRTVDNSRFDKNYDKSNVFSAGLKLNHNLNDNSKVSGRFHYNGLQKYAYTNYYDRNFAFTGDDVLVENKVKSNRLVGNIRYDYTFGDSHDIFFRASTNIENDFIKAGGGYQVSNAIYDFEIQDNISIGTRYDLSLGANFRLVNFDIHDINNAEVINYIEPDSRESIKGVFVQDKIKFFGDRLNIILGIKSENYSLVNSNYYLSPMAKLAFIPNDNLTIWGGYNQSFTTPGFNNTNIDFFLFQTPGIEAWTAAAQQGVSAQVFTQAYDAAIAAGADDATATAIANTEVSNFLASPTGQQTVAATAQSLSQENPNVAVKNGSATVPTRFQTVEFGFRTGLKNFVSLESNFFYTNISDGVRESQDPIHLDEESITQPGRFASYYLYGNYAEGTSIGAENMIRIQPVQGISLELTHSWLQTTWRWQTNEDFDVNDSNVVSDKDITPDVPMIPENVFRFKGQFDLPRNFNFTLGLIHASEFRTQANYVTDKERYENIAIGESNTKIAPNSSRTIVNLRLEKKMINDKLTLYAFGNDITNRGIIADTNNIYNVTLSKIGAMYGFGINFRMK